MPVPNKRTTSTSEAAKVESLNQTMPDAQEFRQRLRNLAVGAVRVVIEEVMREELELCLGAAWGECTERKGYRNGTYTRDLATSSGPIKDLEVPRDREGNFHTQPKPGPLSIWYTVPVFCQFGGERRTSERANDD